MENLQQIMNLFSIPEIVARAMINRGMDTVSKAREFMNTDLVSMYNPYLLKGMEPAVEKILDAIANKYKICVYGDYDVDGITAKKAIKTAKINEMTIVICILNPPF